MARAATKAGPISTNYRLRLNDRTDLQSRRGPIVKLDHKQPIELQMDLAADLASQRHHLMPQHHILRVKPGVLI
jgi:hypothetical protein